ncbi:RNA polymerase sigma factor [Paenibacillus sp. SYP-B3998]|uniref:RNA polymerase sigma factor n=1 Tax=Paenibacillus sp. SYP-B3998 TaxID=2678564 RepID=A0A6G3ZZN3_9BACL|nr:RNA polymerase sigma factor [Paenibacillus sp. SYP-B3998]NEW07508.1 RNA polymerase sigma factor [Paenibacillus sp. SYP-B3998]
MEDLIQRCKQNDMFAFGELFEAYSTEVYQTIFVLVRDRSVAEDATQETFMHLFSKIQQYDEAYPFRNWLYQVALNLSKNYIRKNQNWNNWLKAGKVFSWNNEDSHTPETALYQKELQDHMISHIKTLSKTSQMVITLKYFNEFKQEEIAEILNIPVGTVKWHIHQGLKKLKKSIGSEKIKFQEGFIHE